MVLWSSSIILCWSKFSFWRWSEKPVLRISKASFFHLPTCWGWTSNLLAIWGTVSSALIASNATLAFSSALNVFFIFVDFFRQNCTSPYYHIRLSNSWVHYTPPVGPLGQGGGQILSGMPGMGIPEVLFWPCFLLFFSAFSNTPLDPERDVRSSVSFNRTPNCRKKNTSRQVLCLSLGAFFNSITSY